MGLLKDTDRQERREKEREREKRGRSQEWMHLISFVRLSKVFSHLCPLILNSRNEPGFLSCQQHLTRHTFDPSFTYTFPLLLSSSPSLTSYFSFFAPLTPPSSWQHTHRRTATNNVSLELLWNMKWLEREKERRWKVSESFFLGNSSVIHTRTGSFITFSPRRKERSEKRTKKIRRERERKTWKEVPNWISFLKGEQEEWKK